MAWFETFDRLMRARAGTVRVETDALMAEHTSFRIGGPAKRMAFPKDEAETAAVVACCRETGIGWLVIGRGTNLLAADAGLDYVVVNMTAMDEVRVEENGIVNAQAGAQLARIAVAAQQAGLAGLAFAHGIPGSLGGAVAMNAGAYGGEMCQVVEEVCALYPDGVRTLSGDALGFGYRRSVFSDETAIVLSARLRLKPGDPAAIRAEMDDLMARRKASQPLEYPSAGSTFKRPEGHFAGTMIDQCGLKGRTVGGAQVSEKHAGFLINRGGATCGDVLALMEIVQKTVQERFDVSLSPEVKILS